MNVSVLCHRQCVSRGKRKVFVDYLSVAEEKYRCTLFVCRKGINVSKAKYLSHELMSYRMRKFGRKKRNGSSSIKGTRDFDDVLFGQFCHY